MQRERERERGGGGDGVLQRLQLEHTSLGAQMQCPSFGQAFLCSQELYLDLLNLRRFPIVSFKIKNRKRNAYGKAVPIFINRVETYLHFLL